MRFESGEVEIQSLLQRRNGEVGEVSLVSKHRRKRWVRLRFRSGRRSGSSSKSRLREEEEREKEGRIRTGSIIHFSTLSPSHLLLESVEELGNVQFAMLEVVWRPW